MPKIDFDGIHIECSPGDFIPPPLTASHRWLIIIMRQNMFIIRMTDT